MEIVIYTDGGSRGNPGPAACGFVVEEKDKIIFRGSKFLGNQTNNFAEYSGVIIALEWVIQDLRFKNQDKITFLLDSELVVKQLNGLYKIKNENLKNLNDKIKKIILDKKINVIFKNIPREKNTKADQLVNQELDRNIS